MEKIQTLQEVLEVDWSEAEDVKVNRDLVRLVRCVVNDTKAVWYDDSEFIEILLDNFDDEHAVWDYIEIQ